MPIYQSIYLSIYIYLSVNTNMSIFLCVAAVLVEAARGVLKEDLAMGLLLLLSLREVEEARAVLAALPRTDISLQVCGGDCGGDRRQEKWLCSNYELD